ANATLNDEDMLRAAKAGVAFGIIPEPMVAGRPRYSHVWSHRNGIWKDSPEPEAAWTFLKYLCGPQGQRALSVFPSIKSIFYDFGDGQQPYMPAFYELLDLPNTYEWLNQHPYRFPVIRGAALDVWQQVMHQTLARADIQAALDAAVPA